jgi:hypothetical protein
MCNEGHTLIKGLNEIFPYCLLFHPNMNVFGTGDFCECIFCGCEFCDSRCNDSRPFLMGVKEFCVTLQSTEQDGVETEMHYLLYSSKPENPWFSCLYLINRNKFPVNCLDNWKNTCDHVYVTGWEYEWNCLDTTVTIEYINVSIHFEWDVWQRVSPGSEILRRLGWLVMIECISIYVIHFRIFGMDCWKLGEEFTSSVSVIFNIRNLRYFWVSQMLLPQRLFCKREKKQFQEPMCSGDWWFVWIPRGGRSVCFSYIIFC